MMIRRAMAVAAVMAMAACTAAHGADIVLSPIAGDARAMIEGALGRARPGDRVVLKAGEYRVIGGVQSASSNDLVFFQLPIPSFSRSQFRASLRPSGWQVEQLSQCWKQYFAS